MSKVFLSTDDVTRMATIAAQRMVARPAYAEVEIDRVYGVPRGGVPAAYALVNAMNVLKHDKVAEVVGNPGSATIVFDDLIDSGRTQDMFNVMHPTKSFDALLDKRKQFSNNWVVFPWEAKDADNDESITDNVTRMLQYIGEDPTREGLLETPRRVVKAWKEMFQGYRQDPGALFKVFTDGAEHYKGDEMVLSNDIPVYSHCEHHILPFFGAASIAYIPNKKIVGLSKMARVVKCFSQRLQVQERLTNQIADAFMEHLDPKGVGIIIKARHMCMECRGVCVPGITTTTSALRGALLLNPAAKSEFLMLAK